MEWDGIFFIIKIALMLFTVCMGLNLAFGPISIYPFGGPKESTLNNPPRASREDIILRTANQSRPIPSVNRPPDPPPIRRPQTQMQTRPKSIRNIENELDNIRGE